MAWYDVQNPDAIASPALLVYPDRVLNNIRLTIRLTGGDAARLRPHVKTHKMRAVTELLLDEGIRQFKCATLKEARMLAEAGGAYAGQTDVMLAYPLVGPAVTQLAALRAEFPAVRFSCLIDASASAQRLSDAFPDDPLDVYIDLNVGMNRTGIRPSDAPALYEFARNLPGIRVVGLHAYDGHIRNTDLDQRRHHADETFALADGVRQAIDWKPGGLRPQLVMGGTPTFALHARQSDVVVSPGTFVFWDAGYGQTLPDLPFDVAAVLLTRVISVIDEQTLCLDLGHKSVAAENPLPRVIFLNQPDAQPVGQSEEHLVVRVANAHDHPPGTVWYGVPIHICPTVNLYDSVSVVVDGQYVDTWPVTARGH
ncbi:D-TA family PLP-dependent enzyme [Spirosoma taeanense]|uniref:D-TA family PLP-dependent enzyme n=1 Tax=Spirosoma taeanense TaxID=2735870 RepID=A0A6M5Y9V2_9BACT|nr:D-TA family PLP-dependent enzyme [Spirosoma taeanense]QJW90136.1 D-TA family PLP-dependent enzyme [Spirosoma taeanense]